MQWGNKTKVFFSASSQPGNFGASIYNYFFEKLDINAVYLPRRVTNAVALLEAIKTFEIDGCSVSMPLKTEIANLIDNLDEAAKRVMSVNTIVNESGTLTGYNTDIFGAYTVLENLIQPNSALIYGSGSVTASVIAALKDYGCEKIKITARNEEKELALVEKFKIDLLDDSTEERFDVLINTTPPSKTERNSFLFSLLKRVKILFDLPVSVDDTVLISEAKSKGLLTIPGLIMSKYQLQKQFYIYTGHWLDIEEINSAIESHFLTSNR